MMMRKPKKSQKKDNKLSSSNAVSVYHYDSISGYSLFILTSTAWWALAPILTTFESKESNI